MKAATRTLRARVLGIALAAAGAGAVQAQGTLTPEQLTLRVERLTELSQRSEAKLGTIQEQLLQLSEEMSRMGRLVDNRAVVDMIQQVDQLSGEISQLTGSIEQQVFEIEGIKKRQRELYADIDRRLRDLESGAATMAPPVSVNTPQPETTAPSTSQQSASFDSTASLGTQGTNQTAGAVTSFGPVSSEERDAYEAAFETLKEGRYKNAKTELRAFIDKYPNSSLAGNAQYWLGEAFYVTRGYEEGMAEFRGVLEKYPTSNKVPDAMLKLGYTFYELKQFPEAKSMLNELRQKFPNETAARLAGDRLERIRKEGH